MSTLSDTRINGGKIFLLDFSDLFGCYFSECNLYLEDAVEIKAHDCIFENCEMTGEGWDRTRVHFFNCRFINCGENLHTKENT